MPEPGRLIALVGAESTGKTRLSLALQQTLAEATGLRIAVVPEYLRLWCDEQGRTPRAEEQAGIAAEHERRIEAARLDHDLVLCDTTPLMVAVYSDYLFDDPGLYPAALALHRRCELTLLTALDIPWAADPMRDGPHVRDPVDAKVRHALLGAGLGWAAVMGTGATRLDSALNAVTPVLARQPSPRNGLLTRLNERQAAMPQWRWACDCDDAACEHASLALQQKRP